MTPAEQIHEKILKLKELIDTQNPGMEHWLRDIHQNLHKDESLVQVLSPEETGIIVSGLSQKAKTVIIEEAVAKKTSKAKLGQLSIDQI